MKAFISYAERDHQAIHVLQGVLSGFGIQPVTAAGSRQPGKSLSVKVRELISESDCVVVLLTPAGAASVWVQQEIGMAQTLDKPIVPLKTRNVRSLGMLEGVEYHPLRMSDPQADFESVGRYLQRVAGELGLSLADADDSYLDDGMLLHLPFAVICPGCEHVNNHVWLCLICGDWVCVECGDTVPPSERAS